MGRRRSAANRDLPPNLYVRSGYYSWTDPRNGKVYGIGRDKRDAIAQAYEANLSLQALPVGARLLDRLDGGTDIRVDDWCGKYDALLDDRRLAPGTLVTYRRQLRVIREKLGSLSISRISTRDIADFLAHWKASPRMAQAMRSLTLDVFREALAAGWVESNPVEPTRAPRHEVARARLTLESYQAIHAAAATLAPWVQQGMELALVTAQRRSDIVKLGPGNVRDGRLWVTQDKRGAKVCIPLSLKLEAIGLTVGDVIARCKSQVSSQRFLHHIRHIGTSRPGDAIPGSTLAAGFAEARDLSGLTWEEGKTPPTFHELRSLAARLYHEQGIDAQALLGHKTADMTAVYRDPRGAEWVEVKVA